MSAIQSLQVVGLLTVLLYLGVMFLARAHLIAWNSIHSLEGRIESVRADVQALGLTGGPQQAVTGLADEVEKRTRKAGRWTSRLASSGGEENQGWEMIHHAEEILIASMADADVQARLHRARANLVGDDTACATAWRAVVDRHLEADGAPKASWSLAAARADLGQVVEHCHRKQDESFRTLAEVSNKTQWLVVAGLIFIGATILLLPSAVPLLGLGAIGGLASRIRLISHASAIPTDYGAFWAPLFLAPVLGALLGWSGIYLVQLAGALGVLSDKLSTVTSALSTDAIAQPTSSASTPLAYGLAILFGFTEGAFNGVASLLNKQLEAAPAAGAAQPTTAVQP